MTKPPRSPPESETPDPAIERPGDASVRRDAVWLIAQQIHELASDFARNATKTDRLIADVESLSKDVKALSGALTFAKGFGACAVLLIPASAWLIWRLIGGKLNNIRDEIYHARPAVYGHCQWLRNQERGLRDDNAIVSVAVTIRPPFGRPLT